jgi:hypothetical protein
MLRYSLFLFALLCVSSSIAQAQDVTYIKIQGPDNQELAELCEFMDIAYWKVSCSDTNLRGKVFVLYLEEYVKGEVVSCDTLAKPEVEVIDITPEGETQKHYYILDGNEKMMFKENDSLITIKMFGRADIDSVYYMQYRFPGMMLTKYIPSKDGYRLFGTNNCGKDGFECPVGVSTPVLAYAPGAAEGPMQSFCSLRALDAKVWYEKCQLEHYWLISLEITDPQGRSADEIIKEMNEKE